MSPYQGLPARAFWRTGIVQQTPTTIDDLYQKKFEIAANVGIATAGSCFAQHISRHLRERGYRVLDVEPPPSGLSGDEAKKFGYELYSARYGNIYVVRQLLQLLQETRGRFQPQDWVWERNGRYFDALRPGVEPNGLDSPEEVQAHRVQHLAAVRRLTQQAGLFVFTLGLTEAWVHKKSGTVYATAPGTIAGAFDAEKYEFKNFSFLEIYKDFLLVRRHLKRSNPNLRFLVTVSPVPLTATASGQHVLAATIYSKSVLRSVAGQLCEEFDDVDYFPSYELIASHFSKGAFYEPNLRAVSDAGVAAAMRAFLLAHHAQPVQSPPAMEAQEPVDTGDQEEDNVVCEDMLLEAFAP